MLIEGAAFAQPGKNPVVKEKPTTQKELDKMLENEMNGMSEEEKAAYASTLFNKIITRGDAAEIGTFTPVKGLFD